MKNNYFNFINLLALIACMNDCFSQNKQIDSLQHVLKTAKEDTNKVNALNQLSRQLCLDGYNDSSFVFSNAAKILAEKTKFKKGIAQAYSNIAMAHTDLGEVAEAVKNYTNALKIYEEIGNKAGIGNMYFNIGRVYSSEAKFDEALKNHLAGLQIRLEIGDKKTIGNSYNNLGNLYYDQGIYPEALKNQLAALKVQEEANDKKGAANSYNNIGNIYADQGNFTQALKNYSASLNIRKNIKDRSRTADSYINIGSIYYDQGNFDEALKNYLEAQKIQEELGDQQGLSYSYTGIGLVYIEMGIYEEALKNHLAALKIKEELGQKYGIANSYVNLCVTYKALKKYPEAENYGVKALTLSKEIGFLEGIKSSNLSLSDIYRATGHLDKALDAYKAYTVAKDSLVNEANTQKTTQSQMLYEFDKKESATKQEQEKKDALTAGEKRKQQIITIAVSIVLILVLGLAGAIWRSLRVNQKKNRIIEQQKQLVEHQKHIVEEKHKEITDSINYAERIQKSFLATKELLDTNLKDYFVFFQPKDVVSGDFYWAASIETSAAEGHKDLFAFATADSTGHGVPGAIMSLLNITSLEKAIEHHHEPNEILNHTRKTIIERLKKDGSAEGGKDGMDCSLLCFNFVSPLEGGVQRAGDVAAILQVAAANNPVWIIRPNSPFEGGVRRTGDIELIEIKPDKMPVGKHDKDKEPFTTHTITLKKGDIIYTLTDGFPDQFGGPDGKKFMGKKLKQLLLDNAHLPMNEQKQLLESTFKNWIGDIEQIDDVTVIGIRI